MNIVTGANGTLGREVVEQLLRRVPPEEIGVSVRDVEAAAPLAARGVRVRRGDFTDPDSLRSAFEGATRVLIVSSNTRAGDTTDQHRVAISAAVAAGAGRIIYTSHMGAHAESAFLPARNHAATEELLRESGVPFTSMRNGFYAVTPTYHLAGMRERGRLDLPADGPTSWTTQSDLAQAAAILLAGDDRFDGPTPPLTAQHAYDFADVARMLSELTGAEVGRTVVDDDAWVDAAVSGGMPEAAARFTLGMFEAMRAGDFASTDPALENLLGRPPIALRDVLADVV